MRDWQALAERIRREPDVVGVAPYLDLQGMLGRGEDLRAALIRGIEPQLEPQVSEIGTHMKAGRLDDLQPGERHIVLGAGLAYALDARIGDEITVLVPVAGKAGEGAIAGIDLQPRIQTFTVSGVFEVGAQEHDNVLAFVNLQDAAAIAGSGGVPGGLRLKFADIFAAPTRVKEIAASLGSGLQTSDWSIENASYFRAVGIEKTMMTLILMLIVAVAAFNIVAALVMVVNEKRTDIAILRTVGIAPRAVVGSVHDPGRDHRLVRRAARPGARSVARAERRHHRAVPRGADRHARVRPDGVRDIAGAVGSALAAGDRASR